MHSSSVFASLVVSGFFVQLSVLLPRRHHCRLLLFVSPVVSRMISPATPVIDSSTMFVVAQSIFLWFISSFVLTCTGVSV
jgi:hypothetical protein